MPGLPKEQAIALLAKGRANRHKPKIELAHPYGKAMSLLSPLQQRYVEQMCENPVQGKKNALIAAGYKGTEPGAYAMTKRLMNNPYVLDAMAEASKFKLRAITPNAVTAIKNVIADPK